MERVHTLVLGTGVIGLSCARALARLGREVVLCDLSGAVGTGTSSRNSEVIHAGLYYPQGSRKAKHCLRGSEMLRRFCLEREVPHRICGKLIVATSEAQLPELKALEMKAAGNGVKLEPLSPQQVQQMEPEVYCVEALHSPRTGIVDSHAFMQALLADAEEYGATLALRTQLRGGQVYQEGVMVELESVDSADVFTVEAQAVVNCCGLAAPRVARSLGMERVPEAFYCRGSYYALQGGLRPFSRLVYPVPEPQTSGLGVHATVDLQGQVRFGPDVEWLPPEILPGLEVDEAAYGSHQAAAYQVDDKKSEAFYSEVRRYWPKLPDGALVADYSGVRPKLSAPGEPAADFQVASYGKLVNLFGIESPGLTSAMSLAEEVVQLVEGGEAPPDGMQ